MKNAYEVRGQVTVIFLKRRHGSILEALIDTCDFPRVSNINATWCTTWSSEAHRFYVRATVIRNGKSRTLYLHRLIMNPPPNLMVDHLTGDGLDNRRAYLRLTTNAGNIIRCDRQLRSDNTSGFRGVWWHPGRRQWSAGIRVHGRRKYLGYFTDPEKASHAVQAAIKEHPEYSK